MSTTRLSGLSIKACRSFVEKSTVSFPETGLVLLKGHNRDTGGSSGSGKSSLVLALAHAFGYCPFPSTGMQSWLTEDPYEVSVNFSVDGNEAVLTRGNKTSLKFDGATVKGSVKVVEEKVRQLVGLPPELLEALTYRGQKKESLFLSMSDADKKEFLSKVLGLDKFEQIAEEAAEKAKAILTGPLASKKAAVNYLENVVTQGRQALVEPQLVDIEPLRQFVEERKRGLEVARQEAKSAQALYEMLQRSAQEASNAVVAKHKDLAATMNAELERAMSEEPPPVDESKVKEVIALRLQCLDRYNTAKSAEQDRHTQHMAVKAALEKRLYAAESTVKGEALLMKRKADVLAEIAHIEGGTCPTCRRAWTESQAALTRAKMSLDAIEGSLREVATAREEARLVSEQLEKYPRFEPDAMVQRLFDALHQCEVMLTDERMKVEAQKESFRRHKSERVNAIQTKIISLREQVMREMQEAGSQLQAQVSAAGADSTTKFTNALSWEEYVRNAEDSLREAESQNRTALAVFEAAKEALAQNEVRLQQAQDELAAVEAQYRAEADFASLVGREGFLGVIFEEVLAEIADEANTILAAVPNTAHVSISFRTESFTQKGTTKKSIVLVVSNGGHEAPMASGLSGGMQTAVQLAVDLAVTTVVSRRTGAVPGWFILDEALDGLGVVEKEACLEILQRFASDRLVLVVDHATEVKEAFSKTIDVEYSGGYSRVLP